MIPAIENEVLRYEWLSAEQFAEVVSIAGMAPGPVATNLAAIVGYRLLGIPGAILTILSTLLPSFIIIIIICLVLYRIEKFQLFESVFYGLRPIITGLIVFAALRYAAASGLLQWNWQFATTIFIFIISLIALIRFRLHPLFAILGSAVIGMILYS